MACCVKQYLHGVNTSWIGLDWLGLAWIGLDWDGFGSSVERCIIAYHFFFLCSFQLIAGQSRCVWCSVVWLALRWHALFFSSLLFSILVSSRLVFSFAFIYTGWEFCMAMVQVQGVCVRVCERGERLCCVVLYLGNIEEQKSFDGCEPCVLILDSELYLLRSCAPSTLSMRRRRRVSQPQSQAKS